MYTLSVTVSEFCYYGYYLVIYLMYNDLGVVTFLCGMV